jgi:hypothetical protein
MSGWRRCDTCRKVRSTDEYDGGVATCRDCQTGRSAPARRKTAPVTRTAAPRPAKAEPAPAGPRKPLLGTVGNGDLEVRERRARRAALELLAESHPEEFGLLLRDARAKEKLRPLSTESAGSAHPAAGTDPAVDPAAGSDGRGASES